MTRIPEATFPKQITSWFMLERRTEDTYFVRARCLGDRRILPQLKQRHYTIKREAYDRPSASTVYSELFFSASLVFIGSL